MMKLRNGIALLSLTVLLLALFVSPLTAEESSASDDDLLEELGVSFKPTDFTFTSYAETDRLILEADAANAVLRITEKSSGAVWKSSDENFSADRTSTGLVRGYMGSQLIAKYVDATGNITGVSSRQDCVLDGSVTVEAIPNGVRFVYTFHKAGFVIPVEYTIEGDALVAAVIVPEIQETKSYQMYSVSLLPYFGAGSTEDEGYMFVPDGSGALIYYNNGKSNADLYSQRVYGRDDATALKAQGPVTQSAALPVFGVKHNDAAFLAVIGEGASRALINASVSGYNSAYNTVYAEFLYRNYDTVAVKEKNWDSHSVKVFESTPASCATFTVNYYFLTPEQSDYTGMAARYRQYLQEEQGIRPVASNGLELSLELIGSIKKQQYFLGIPYTATIPLTSYAEAASILSALHDGGVGPVSLDYQLWSSSSSTLNIPTSLNTNSRLGGDKAFDALMEQVNAAGDSLFCGINLTDMTASRLGGYNRLWDSTRSLGKSPSLQYCFNPATYETDTDAPTIFLLSPRYILEAAQKAAANLSKRGATGFSATTLSEKLYSDFGNQPVDRTESETIWQQALKTLADAGSGLTVSAANAYALTYATLVTDVPTDSSRFNIEDEAVPFYALSLHGLLPMTTASLNFFSSETDMFLKAVELGIGLRYTWTASNESKLQETAYDYLYSTHYEYWLADAISLQKELNEAVGSLAGQAIVGHATVADDVVCTTYEDGTAVWVNYAKEPYTTPDGVTVAAKGYRVIR